MIFLLYFLWGWGLNLNSQTHVQIRVHRNVNFGSFFTKHWIMNKHCQDYIRYDTPYGVGGYKALDEIPEWFKVVALKLRPVFLRVW